MEKMHGHKLGLKSPLLKPTHSFVSSVNSKRSKDNDYESLGGDSKATPHRNERESQNGSEYIVPHFKPQKDYFETLTRRSFMGDFETLAGHHQTIVQEIIKDKERIIQKDPKHKQRRERSNGDASSRRSSVSSSMLLSNTKRETQTKPQDPEEERGIKYKTSNQINADLKRFSEASDHGGNTVDQEQP